MRVDLKFVRVVYVLDHGAIIILTLYADNLGTLVLASNELYIYIIIFWILKELCYRG